MSGERPEGTNITSSAVASGSNGVHPAAAPPPSAASSTEIQESFTLGWSIAELRARVEAAALKLLAASAPVLPPAAAPGPGQDADAAASALLLQNDRDASDALWMASMWCVLFGRISGLHKQLFDGSRTDHTYYDPGDGIPPYLYPSSSAGDDYADVGVGSLGPGDAPVLAAFRLREATRRAINCLILLHMQPDLALRPDLLTQRRAQLIAAIHSALPPATPATAAAPPTGANDGAKANGAAAVEPPPPEAADETARHAAITALTKQTVLFLDAWDGYLRESFYLAGVTAKDETKLTAYEAGRAMARLSWQLTIRTAPTDGEAKQTDADLWAAWLDAFDERRVSTLQRQLAVLGKALDNDYFASTGHPRPTESPLSAAIDPDLPGAALHSVVRSLDYWARSVHWLHDRRHALAPDTAAATELLERLRLTLIAQTSDWQALVLGQHELRAYTVGTVVRQIMQEVMSSFEDIWQQSVVKGAAAVSDEIKVAADKAGEEITAALGSLSQTAKQSLGKVAQVVLPALIVVAVLAVVVTVLVIVLALQGQPMAAGITSSVTSLAIAAAGSFGLLRAHYQSNSGANALDAVDKEVRATIGTQMGDVKTAAATAATETATNTADASAGASAPAEAASTEGLSVRLGRVFGTATSEVLQTFERGFKQVEIDLAGLGYDVAVSYPLVEFFVLNNHDFSDIKADYDFLKTVIWDATDREEEVRRVAYAAFGPIGLLALAKKDAPPPA